MVSKARFVGAGIRSLDELFFIFAIVSVILAVFSRAVFTVFAVFSLFVLLLVLVFHNLLLINKKCERQTPKIITYYSP